MIRCATGYLPKNCWRLTATILVKPPLVNHRRRRRWPAHSGNGHRPGGTPASRSFRNGKLFKKDRTIKKGLIEFKRKSWLFWQYIILFGAYVWSSVLTEACPLRRRQISDKDNHCWIIYLQYIMVWNTVEFKSVLVKGSIRSLLPDDFAGNYVIQP